MFATALMLRVRPSEGRACAIACRVGALLAALTVVAGCGDEGQIRHYRAPKAARPPAVAAPQAPQSPPVESRRMIGAILPHGAQAWFLKLAGPPAALDSHLEPFRQWLRSIHFVDDKPQWQLPQGWREEPGQGMRFATLRIGDGEPLELTVIPLPIPEDDPDYVLSNVNRWRQQLQLGPLTAPQLGEQAEKIQVGDAVATLVDLRSEGTPNK